VDGLKVTGKLWEMQDMPLIDMPGAKTAGA